MHTKTLKKLLLALTFWIALHTAPVQATTILAGTSPAIIEMDANGLLDDIGTLGTGTLSLSGAGTRMIWYPGKAAFRAGYVPGTQWNDANIGSQSVAFGNKTIASGSDSTASGYYGRATNTGTTALGYGALASGSCATALGAWTTASGGCSTSIGPFSTASGYGSFAIAHQNLAYGSNSFAGGFNSQAYGDYSTALGYNASANAYADFVIGRYNVGANLSGTSWNSADPLFEIGNGTSTTPADALVVYKNGNATVQGVLAAHTGLTCPQQGDLSMGSFTAGTAP